MLIGYRKMSPESDCFSFTVDGQVKCEKWVQENGREETNKKETWWLSRFIRRSKKVTVEWPFPFTEEKLFVLTLSAGLEGYHVSVDGKHVTSFPFRTVSHAFLQMLFGVVVVMII